MIRKSTVGLVMLGFALAVAELAPGGMFRGASLIQEAHAVVGRPMTPVSAAGVARRTTRRAVVATSVYVATLPPACVVVVIEGTNLYQCGTTYYQASGTQYVVVKVQ